MSHSQLLGTGVDIHLMPSLCIHYFQQSYVRQLFGSRVIYLNAHHIMFLVGNLVQTKRIVKVVKVTDKESSTVAFHHACEVFQGTAYVGTLALRVEVEHFSDDIKNMLSTLLRWNIFLYSVGKEDDTYLVVVLDGTYQ